MLDTDGDGVELGVREWEGVLEGVGRGVLEFEGVGRLERVDVGERVTLGEAGANGLVLLVGDGDTDGVGEGRTVRLGVGT